MELFKHENSHWRASLRNERRDSRGPHGRTECGAQKKRGESAEGETASPNLQQQLGAGLAAAALSMTALMGVAVPTQAADPAKVGTCLLRNCQFALARCIGNSGCVEDLVCLNACNGRPDETECQIRCGDLYENEAVQAFNACALSDKKCVPQRQDEGLFPEPPVQALDSTFALNNFDGRWYITAGLNPLFDTFDCQKHFFATPDAGKLYARINWRIPLANGDFLERKTIQTFVQNASNPAIMYNHGNEYLHYEDDWYILAFRPDEYVFIYYRGNNDAWKGYGGATVYTRAAALPKEYVPELRDAAARANLDWSKFTITDNTCPGHPNLFAARTPPTPSIRTVAEDLVSFGKGFTVVETQLEDVAQAESGEVQQELKEASKLLNKVERRYSGFQLPFFGSR